MDGEMPFDMYQRHHPCYSIAVEEAYIDSDMN